MKKLQLQYYIFFIVVFVLFSVLIITEKLSPLMNDKVDKKLNNYIKENYKLNNIKTTKTKYIDTVYQKKVVSTLNNNYYFIVYYDKKKITDTYQKDYVEGNTFLKHISKSIQNTIYKKNNTKYTISINNKFNNFTEEVKTKIFKEEDLESLSIYTLSYKLKTTFDNKTISNQIINIDKNLSSNNINPKSYEITITDEKDITNSIKINGINRNIINSNKLNNIIDDIINNKKSNILNENNITYKKLN